MSETPNITGFSPPRIAHDWTGVVEVYGTDFSTDTTVTVDGEATTVVFVNSKHLRILLGPTPQDRMSTGREIKVGGGTRSASLPVAIGFEGLWGTRWFHQTLVPAGAAVPVWIERIDGKLYGVRQMSGRDLLEGELKEGGTVWEGREYWSSRNVDGSISPFPEVPNAQFTFVLSDTGDAFQGGVHERKPYDDYPRPWWGFKDPPPPVTLPFPPPTIVSVQVLGVTPATDNVTIRIVGLGLARVGDPCIDGIQLKCDHREANLVVGSFPRQARDWVTVEFLGLDTINAITFESNRFRLELPR